MTETQLHLFNLLGLVALLVVAYFTRATARRFWGALAGGAAFGLAVLPMLSLGEKSSRWHMAIAWEPYYLTLLFIDFALPAGYVNLLVWRAVRRFGAKGLAVLTLIAAIVGPPRDRYYMENFPDWGSYGPGFAPVAAVSAIYIVMVLLGYAVMRAVAGPDREDRLARTAPESAPAASA